MRRPSPPAEGEAQTGPLILYSLLNHHYFPISRSKDYSLFLG